jgi:hypothetical protein
MVAPGVEEDRLTTTAPFSAAVVAMVGAAARGLDDEPPVVPAPLPQPATTRMLAANAHLSWDPAILDMALILPFIQVI